MRLRLHVCGLSTYLRNDCRQQMQCGGANQTAMTGQEAGNSKLSMRFGLYHLATGWLWEAGRGKASYQPFHKRETQMSCSANKRAISDTGSIDSRGSEAGQVVSSPLCYALCLMQEPAIHAVHRSLFGKPVAVHVTDFHDGYRIFHPIRTVQIKPVILQFRVGP